MKIKVIYAVVKGDQYQNPKLSVYRPLVGESHSCSNPSCKNKFDFEDLSRQCGVEIEHVCCCRSCIDAVMSPEEWGLRYVAPAPVVTEEVVLDPLDPPYVPGDIHPVTGKPRVKPAFCPVCNGPSQRGKGFKHKGDCSERPEAKKAARQAELDAKRASMPFRENCPECGGPPGKIRGWRHKDGCKKKLGVSSSSSESKKAIASAKQLDVLRETVVPVVAAVGGRCPKCNGVADDSEPSGYRHKRDSCTETRKV